MGSQPLSAKSVRRLSNQYGIALIHAYTAGHAKVAVDYAHQHYYISPPPEPRCEPVNGSQWHSTTCERLFGPGYRDQEKPEGPNA